MATKATQGDQEEFFYWMRDGEVLRKDNKVEDELSLQATGTANSELVEALTSPDGPLANGALPNVKCASERGVTNLAQQVNSELVVTKPDKPKPKDKNKEPKADGPMEPPTTLVLES